MPTQRSKMSRIERSEWDNVGVIVAGFGEVPECGGPDMWVMVQGTEEGTKEAGRKVFGQGFEKKMSRVDGQSVGTRKASRIVNRSG